MAAACLLTRIEHKRRPPSAAGTPKSAAQGSLHQGPPPCPAPVGGPAEGAGGHAHDSSCVPARAQQRGGGGPAREGGRETPLLQAACRWQEICSTTAQRRSRVAPSFAYAAGSPKPASCTCAAGTGGTKTAGASNLDHRCHTIGRWDPECAAEIFMQRRISESVQRRVPPTAPRHVAGGRLGQQVVERREWTLMPGASQWPT